MRLSKKRPYDFGELKIEITIGPSLQCGMLSSAVKYASRRNVVTAEYPVFQRDTTIRDTPRKIVLISLGCVDVVICMPTVRGPSLYRNLSRYLDFAIELRADGTGSSAIRLKRTHIEFFNVRKQK